MRILLLLAVLLTIALPAPAQEATGPIATESSAQQDAAIASRIREILVELGNYSDVEVSVNEGVVTFRGTITSAQDATVLGALANRVQGVVAVRNEVTETTDIGERLHPAIDRFRARMAQFINFLPLVLIAGLILAVVVFVGFAIARMRQPWERLAPNTFVADIYRQLLRVVFVIIGIVIALDILNASALLGTILGAAGIIGLALGFAVRDTVENFIASIMLSFRQPFRPNDTIEINGDIGKVIRLTSRATILLSFDGNHIRIPNATVFKSRIINYTQNTERRFMFSIIIERDADLLATRTLAETTMQALPFILAAPPAQTWIEAIHPEGVELVVTGWVDQNETSLARAKGEALRQVKLAVEAAGVTIPDSTQTIALQRRTTAPANTMSESTRVETVSATETAALTKIVTVERETDKGEDLLREDSPKE